MIQARTYEYYATNKLARITLLALEEIVGEEDTIHILRYANLSDLIKCYPANNLAREYAFADFAAITYALEQVYGKQAGHGLALRVGRAIFSDFLHDLGMSVGLLTTEFKILPTPLRLQHGIVALASMLSQVFGQKCTHDLDQNAYYLTVRQCPVCWGHDQENQPICYLTVGFLREGVKWLSAGGEFCITETRCVAMGDPLCQFEIPRTPIEN